MTEKDLSGDVTEVITAIPVDIKNILFYILV